MAVRFNITWAYVVCFVFEHMLYVLYMHGARHKEQQKVSQQKKAEMKY